MREGENWVNILMLLIHYTLSAKTQQHMAEVSQLELLVWSSQDLLRKQIEKFGIQMDQLTMAESDNEKLIVDTMDLLEIVNVIKKSENIKK